MCTNNFTFNLFMWRQSKEIRRHGVCFCFCRKVWILLLTMTRLEYTKMQTSTQAFTQETMETPGMTNSHPFETVCQSLPKRPFTQSRPSCGYQWASDCFDHSFKYLYCGCIDVHTLSFPKIKEKPRKTQGELLLSVSLLFLIPPLLSLGPVVQAAEPRIKVSESPTGPQRDRDDLLRVCIVLGQRSSKRPPHLLEKKNS